MLALAFLTDYGTHDGFVAVCHGVIATTAPDARVIDVSHEVPPYDVRHGAAVLRRVVPYFPPAVYLAVVDPGVGTERRPVVLRAGPSLLVGPDNGLLLPAADALGSVREAYALTNPGWRLRAVGATFHGRDVFAPAAARLAAGAPITDAGAPVPAAELVRLPVPSRSVRAGELDCASTYVDRYGNVQLAATAADLEVIGARQASRLTVSSPSVVATAVVAHTFGDVRPGDLVVYTDSDGQLAVAENTGDAAVRFGIRAGDPVRLTVR